MRTPYVALVVAALLAPTVWAATTSASLPLTTGNNWAAATVAPAAPCVSVKAYVNFTGGASARFLAFWLVADQAFGSTTVYDAVGGAIWEEPDGIRVTTTTPDGVLVEEGATALNPTQLSYDWGRICTFPDMAGWKRVGLAAPGAANARLALTLEAPTAPALAGVKGGANAIALSDRDFTGYRVDVAATRFAGASVAEQLTKVLTLPKGSISLFVSTDTVAFLGANSTAGTFGRNGAVCTGAHAVGTIACERYFGAQPFGALGLGKASVAAAGKYTFRVEDEVGAEPVHVALVSAPVDWY